MKIKDKEKLMIILLIFTGITSAYFYFYLKPQLAKIDDLKSSIMQARNINQTGIIYEQELEKLRNEIRVENKKLQDIKDRFPSYISKEELTIFLSDVTKNTGFNVDDGISIGDMGLPNISATMPAIDMGVLNSIKDKEMQEILKNLGITGASNGNFLRGAQTQIANGTLYSIKVTLTGSGTMNNLKNLINYFLDLKNMVVIDSFSMAPMTDKNEQVTSTIGLEFYGILDKSINGYGFLSPGSDWSMLNPVHRDYLFKSDDGTENAQQVVNPTNRTGNNDLMKAANINTQEEYEKSNFTVAIDSYSQDLGNMTVNLSAKEVIEGEDRHKTNKMVYGNNKGKDEVLLFISVKENKYYFRMSTEEDGYPSRDSGELAEFNPINGNIELLILSSPKKFPYDTAGINLTLWNASDRRVIVKVYDEDPKPENRRVNFVEKEYQGMSLKQFYDVQYVK